MADLMRFLNPSGDEGDSSKKDKGASGGKRTDSVSDDGGVDVGRREKSSFDDFGDSPPMISRRGSYDDDDDDDDDDDYDHATQKKPVDLNAFMTQGQSKQEIAEADLEEGGDDDEEEEEDDEEEADEDEYVTEEDQADQEESPIAGGEEIPGETPSQEELRRQKEFNAEMLKQKKKDLINEYLKDIKRMHHLRARNVFLTLKIQSKAREAHDTIEKYIEAERDEVRRKRESERLKQLHLQKQCEAQRKKFMKEMRRREREEPKVRKPKQFRPHFEPGRAPTRDHHHHGNLHCTDKCDKEAEDVSMKALRKEHKYDLSIMYGEPGRKVGERARRCSKAGKRSSSGKGSGKPADFSFRHSLFFQDVAKSNKKSTDYMNININQLKSKGNADAGGGVKSAMRKSVKIGGQVASRKSSVKVNTKNKRVVSKRVSYLGLMKGFRSKRKFEVTQEASRFAKSKTKMALSKEMQEHQILLPNEAIDLKQLNHFRFEFADPRLTARQVSLKLRNELLSLLRERKIPMGTYKKWPMEIKGMSFNGKNPYGRVTLNYTRLSHHDQDLPNLAYRMALTNIAYLKSKDAKMKEMHSKNMETMQEERQRLESGCKEILNEVIKGLRICASLSGTTTIEKQKAKEDTENFIAHLYLVYDNFLTKFLVKLYKAINANSYALRQLHISEGKGEGAELHEFKDIMRCADKLKVEHKGVQKLISQYQTHCKRLLKIVRRTDGRVRAVNDNVDYISGDLRHMTKAVSTMIEGMYWSKQTSRLRLDKEIELKATAGIISSPSLFEDYLKIKDKVIHTKAKRDEMARKVHAQAREIHKIIPLKTDTLALKSYRLH